MLWLFVELYNQLIAVLAEAGDETVSFETIIKLTGDESQKVITVVHGQKESVCPS